jgi:hypothetical protein
MRVKIIKSSFHDNWYTDKIGQEFEVNYFDNDFWFVFGTAGYSVTKEDAEIVSEEIYTKTPLKQTADYIIEECENIKNLLLEKNRKYGDSATRKGMVFNLQASTAIKDRINDKLSRLRNDNKDEDEDIILDLLGYFILLRIALKKEQSELPE